MYSQSFVSEIFFNSRNKISIMLIRVCLHQKKTLTTCYFPVFGNNIMYFHNNLVMSLKCGTTTGDTISPK